MRKDQAMISPEVRAAGRIDIGARDIQSWLKHRSEISPTTDNRTHQIETMIGALKIGFNAFSEAHPEIDKLPKGPFVGEPYYREVEVDPTARKDSPTQYGIKHGIDNFKYVARVTFRHGKFNFTEDDQRRINEADDEERQRRRLDSGSLYNEEDLALLL